MNTIKPINQWALYRLNRARTQLTGQQFKTLRGQILAGNHEAALKGLQKLTERRAARLDYTARHHP